jgi:hypothetical protein
MLTVETDTAGVEERLRSGRRCSAGSKPSATPPATTDETRRPRRPRSTDRAALRHAPMTPEETGSYLRHHVALAGGSDTLFSDDGCSRPRLPHPQ